MSANSSEEFDFRHSPRKSGLSFSRSWLRCPRPDRCCCRPRPRVDRSRRPGRGPCSRRAPRCDCTASIAFLAPCTERGARAEIERASRFRFGVEFIGRAQLRRQPGGRAFLAGEHAAGHQDLFGARHAGEQHEALNVLEVDDDAELEEGMPSFASSAGDRKSQTVASWSPPPRAAPWIASDRRMPGASDGLEHPFECREELECARPGDRREVGARAEDLARRRRARSTRTLGMVVEVVDRFDDRIAQLDGESVPRVRTVEREMRSRPLPPNRRRRTAIAYSITAITSPSCTTPPPSVTLTSEIDPEAVASTGISIFIDSRMHDRLAFLVVALFDTTTFHTFATISASTSSAQRFSVDGLRSRLITAERSGGDPCRSGGSARQH